MWEKRAKNRQPGLNVPEIMGLNFIVNNTHIGLIYFEVVFIVLFMIDQEGCRPSLNQQLRAIVVFTFVLTLQESIKCSKVVRGGFKPNRRSTAGSVRFRAVVIV